MALSLAVDREFIIRNIREGFGVIAGGPMGTDSPNHNPAVQPVPYDPKRALEILKECGWADDGSGFLQKEGKRFQFTALVPDGVRMDRITAEYLILAFNDIGIRIRLEFIPLDELRRRYTSNTEFQAALTGIQAPWYSYETLVDQWASRDGKGAAIGCFEDDGVTSFLRQALSESNPHRKVELFQEADARIASLHPGTFLFHEVSLDVVSRRITLSAPFASEVGGFYGLRKASVNREWQGRR